LQLHRERFARSALADLLGADFGPAEAHKLHACHDRLSLIRRRWRDLFNLSFDVLLYDLTSTYFGANPPRRRDVALATAATSGRIASGW